MYTPVIISIFRFTEDLSQLLDHQTDVLRTWKNSPDWGIFGFARSKIFGPSYEVRSAYAY